MNGIHTHMKIENGDMEILERSAKRVNPNHTKPNILQEAYPDSTFRAFFVEEYRTIREGIEIRLHNENEYFSKFELIFKGVLNEHDSCITWKLISMRTDSSISFVVVMHSQDYKKVAKQEFLVIENGPSPPNLDFIIHDPLIKNESKVSFFVEGEIKGVKSISTQGSDGDIPQYGGLVNNGMTCYMNSFLQALFQIRIIPINVFKFDTTKNERSWSFEFQRLFYNLLNYPELPTETKFLTKAFGWTSRDIFTQQDAQEFCCVILDALENKCKSEGISNFISDLFQGVSRNYIKCQDIEFQSTRDEHFLDIQLPIKGCSDIYKSFDLYTFEEKLSGENQYETDTANGKQNAIKGIKFIRFPKILMLHLKRVEFDFETMRDVKITSKHEFYQSIDLQKYLHPESDQQGDAKFQLFAILVHQGSQSGFGHYYEFCRPCMSDVWYKFNDEDVSQVPYYTVLKESIGALSKIMLADNGIDFRRDNYSCSSQAYMLIYLKASEIKNILPEIEDEMIPKNVVEFCLRNKKRVIRSPEDSSQGVKIKVALTSLDYLKGLTGVGYLLEREGINDQELTNFLNTSPYYSTQTFLDTTEMWKIKKWLSNETGINGDNMSLFTYDESEKILLKAEDSTTFRNMKGSSESRLLIVESKDPETKIFKERAGRKRKCNLILVKKKSQVIISDQKTEEIDLEAKVQIPLLIKIAKEGYSKPMVEGVIFVQQDSTVGEICKEYGFNENEYKIFHERAGANIVSLEHEDDIFDLLEFTPFPILLMCSHSSVDDIKALYRIIEETVILEITDSIKNKGRLIGHGLRVIKTQNIASLFEIISKEIYNEEIKQENLVIQLWSTDQGLQVLRDNSDERDKLIQEIFIDHRGIVMNPDIEVSYDHIPSHEIDEFIFFDVYYLALNGVIIKITGLKLNVQKNIHSILENEDVSTAMMKYEKLNEINLENSNLKEEFSIQ